MVTDNGAHASVGPPTEACCVRSVVRCDCAADADYIELTGQNTDAGVRGAAGVHDNVVKHNHLVYASESVNSWRGIALTSDAESNDIEFNGTTTTHRAPAWVDRNTKPNASEPPPAARSCQ